jgi:hypothetical protein
MVEGFQPKASCPLREVVGGTETATRSQGHAANKGARK